MKIYTDEYMKRITEIEGMVEQSIRDWVSEIGNDFAVEARNLSWGDSNLFENDVIVRTDVHCIDVSRAIYSKKDTLEAGKIIAKDIRKYLQSLVEKKIDESTLTITKLKDFRKCIKVVVEGDAIIDTDMKALFRVGVKEVPNADQSAIEKATIDLNKHQWNNTTLTS